MVRGNPGGRYRELPTVGVATEILGPEGCPGHVLNCNEEIKRRKIEQSGARTDVLAGSGSGTGPGLWKFCQQVAGAASFSFDICRIGIPSR